MSDPLPDLPWRTRRKHFGHQTIARKLDPHATGNLLPANLVRNCSNFARGAEVRPSFDERWPSLANINMWSMLTKPWPESNTTLASCWQIRPPARLHFGQLWLELAECKPSLASQRIALVTAELAKFRRGTFACRHDNRGNATGKLRLGPSQRRAFRPTDMRARARAHPGLTSLRTAQQEPRLPPLRNS